MSVNILDNINYLGKNPNFVRDLFSTINDMINYQESSLDDGHIAYCIETLKHYKYKSTNNQDETLGKWRLIPDIVILTNEEYELLLDKDENTIYMTYDL